VNSAAPVERRGRIALAALLVGATAIGLAPIFVRLSELGPTATAFHRQFLSLPVLGLWLLWERGAGARAAAPITGRGFQALVAAGIFFAADLAVWHRSIGITSVANATLLANFAPVFVAAAGWLFWRERVGWGVVLGFALAFAGAGLLMAHSLALDTRRLGGDSLALLTAVFYAGYLTLVARGRSRYATAFVMFVTSAASAAVLLPVALVSGENLVPATVRGWLVVLGLALVSHAAGQGLIAYALAHLPATFGAVSLLWQPVAAAVFAYLILHEPLGAWQLVGAALVLAGIATARKATQEREVT
jgi:drug/metabolite transporter (DMT)-like permease